jgi:large subunit ribosomal protein L12e
MTLAIVNIKVFGGEAGPAATLAPKLGPLGLNAKKVGE